MSMYLMMGIPGSGKSTLAKQLAELTNAVICSADDFHVWWGRGRYDWQSYNQAKAHKTCRDLAYYALEQDRDVVVDNTNTSMSEIKTYTDIASYFMADAYLLEPQTDWRYNLQACLVKNTHNVPENTLQAMLNRLQATKLLLGEPCCDVHGHPAIQLK